LYNIFVKQKSNCFYCVIFELKSVISDMHTQWMWYICKLPNSGQGTPSVTCIAISVLLPGIEAHGRLKNAHLCYFLCISAPSSESCRR